MTIAELRLFTENYCQTGEGPREVYNRVAASLVTDEDYRPFRELLITGRFWPSGRILATTGTTRPATSASCFAMPAINDDLDSIMMVAADAAQVIKAGGGVGYALSTLRPRGTPVGRRRIGSAGPVGFMRIYDAVGQVLGEAGSRRTMQMATLRIDHPDIEEFMYTRMPSFNTCVAVTDEFMTALHERRTYPLRYQGRVSGEVEAEAVWEALLRAIWDRGQPYIMFIDRCSRLNPLSRSETITTLDPLGVLPMPAHGTAVLGSFNLAAYEDMTQLRTDAPLVDRAMQAVIHRAGYPSEVWAQHARRRMMVGIGVMGAAEGFKRCAEYGTEDWIIGLCDVLDMIQEGMPGSTLNIAPTQTIAMCAGVSPGIIGTYLLPEEQIMLLAEVQKHVGGGVWYPVQVPRSLKWSHFRDLFNQAWNSGVKVLNIRTDRAIL
jgi:ribonucleoside-diphosphate reductase alpha chain